jgi:succinate dehydrogenase / fumarate reductase flavoprotein subunit
MYHQFKALADIDITTEPMEVGPTTHYVMGGVRVDPDSQMSTTVPGLFAAGEVAAGLHGANRLGGNSLSDLLVFGKRAGEFAAKFAKDNGAVSIHDEQVQDVAKWAIAPFERDPKNNPYAVQYELQDLMQDKVGIVRMEDEMNEALVALKALRERAAQSGVSSNREYNPGWHTALDLDNLMVVSQAITMSAIDRKESRGGHFRDDFPEKLPAYAKHNAVLKKGADGEMELRRVETTPLRDDLAQIIEDNK